MESHDLVFFYSEEHDRFQKVLERDDVKTVFTPAENRKPRKGFPYLCEEVQEVFRSKTGKVRIVTVDLLVELPRFGESLILPFSWEEGPDGLQLRAMEKFGKDEEVTMIFVPDRNTESPETPENPETVQPSRWEFQPTRTIFRSENGRFRIVAVELVEELVSDRAKRRREKVA